MAVRAEYIPGQITCHRNNEISKKIVIKIQNNMNLEAEIVVENLDAQKPNPQLHGQ